MFEYTVQDRPKRSIDFFTISYSNKAKAYKIAISHINPTTSTNAQEKYSIPLFREESVDRFLKFILPEDLPQECSHLFDMDSDRWKKISLFVNTINTAAVLHEQESNIEIPIYGEDYEKIITYFYNNFYTSWIFNSENITKQVKSIEEKRNKE